MQSENIRRRTLLGAPALLIPLGATTVARADGGGGPEALNEEFLAANPDVARVLHEVEDGLTPEELQKVVTALREAPSQLVKKNTPGEFAPNGGKRICFTVRKWVLTTIYVAWKVNGWGAALASIPVAATGAGVGPAVILAGIGIGYGEGADALKAYIDRHKTWPRRVCAWVN